MPPKPWLFACFCFCSLFFLLLVLFNVSAFAGSLVSGCYVVVIRLLFANSCDFRNGCGHFGRPGASILGAWDTILAPWAHHGWLGEQLNGHLSVGSRIFIA